MSSPVHCLDCGCRYLLVRNDGSIMQQTVCPSCGYPGWAPAPETADGDGHARLASSPRHRRKRREISLQPFWA